MLTNGPEPLSNFIGVYSQAAAGDGEGRCSRAWGRGRSCYRISSLTAFTGIRRLFESPLCLAIIPAKLYEHQIVERPIEIGAVLP
jgi:hypothetical protein